MKSNNKNSDEKTKHHTVKTKKEEILEYWSDEMMKSAKPVRLTRPRHPDKKSEKE